MKDLNKSIIESLDGRDDELLPHIPYILQDLWEIGANPVKIISQIIDNIYKMNLKVLYLIMKLFQVHGCCNVYNLTGITGF